MGSKSDKLLAMDLKDAWDEPVEPGGRKPPPTPTEWLDITARDGGLCVAWNSGRYLLTDAQARKLRDALSALLSEVKD